MAFVLSLSGWVFAQGDGGQAGAFLRYGIGGRALGMGRAFTAVADDASGIYWNPAGILGVQRCELGSMYSNLYYDSQYANFSVVLPRLGMNLTDKVARFLMGPSTAIGFAWIGLSMSGFEQRTITGNYLGDFGFAEHALLASWAREEVGNWGILRYGVTFKYVSQNFSGLSDSEVMGVSSSNQDWSGGMDLGMTFQPFHAPVFRIFALRYLIPLRLGVSIHNVIQPGVSVTGNHWDTYPRHGRVGASYRWVLRDWVPASWTSVRDFLGNSQILTAVDYEVVQNSTSGTYYGFEGYFPFSRSGAAVYPRAGYNTRTEGPSIGLGLSLPFTPSAGVRIDYVFTDHPNLPEDNRFFLTFQMGREMGPAFFKNASARQDINPAEAKQHLLRVLAVYPNDYVGDAAEILAEMADSSLARRYYDFTGGLGRASLLLAEARGLVKSGHIERARDKALESADEYAPLFSQPEHALSDGQLLDFGEAYIIANRLDEAVAVLLEVEESSLRREYLLGTAQKAAGDWDGAVETFQKAVRQYENEQDQASMVSLSFLGLGEALFRQGNYDSAITTLDVLLKNDPGSLDSRYPPYPAFEDGYILDDAQFLTGLCTLMLNHYTEGVARLLETEKFYPQLNYGQFVSDEAEQLVNALSASNGPLLGRLAGQFAQHYFQNQMTLWTQ